MDIFKQKRFLLITVIILLLMNITALTLLWIGRPEGPKPHQSTRYPAKENKRLQELLKQELGFDETQVEQYLILRENHQREAQLLDMEIRELKREMFDEVLKENPQPMLSDSLLKLVQEKQAKLEQLTFQHFLDLKKLCKPEQQDLLKILMQEVFRQGRPPMMDGDRPPHPPGGDLPPHPPAK